MSAHPLLHLARLLPLLLGLTGCQSLAYYGQAARGQAALLLKRQPIAQLLADADTPPALRRRLETVQRIRVFAAETLGLPAQRQYTSYVELDRAYPLWAVSAAPPLSLTPHTWCYWLVGCLSYRGFFSEHQAQRYAAALAQQGLDVYLTGVPAYSTLGWFRDPVLSSFISLPEPELAELLFHELTHQVLFVPGDTVFNESLAVTVAEEGLRRYAARYGLDLQQLQRTRQRERQFAELVLAHREQLRARFAAARSVPEKQAARAAVYAALRRDYETLKREWGGYRGYDAWFEGLNNARLNAVDTYYHLVPALEALLQAQGGDMAKFLAACRELAHLDPASRHRRLEALRAAALAGAL